MNVLYINSKGQHKLVTNTGVKPSIGDKVRITSQNLNTVADIILHPLKR